MNDKEWNSYNEWNKRDEGMSDLWISKLVHWVKINKQDLKELTVLDYGCGYFDLGFELIRHSKSVDGYDPFGPAIQRARLRCPGNSILTDDLTSLPNQKYNLIILNSVVQYMGTKDALHTFFLKSKELLQSSGESEIILSDLIPKNYSSVKDALNCMLYACRNGFLVAMMIHLFKAATNFHKGMIFKIDPQEVRELAHQNGFKCTILEDNLTPSKYRYSCLLSLEKHS